MSIDLGQPRVLPADEAERAVLLAAPRGYCAGVDRAVITVEKALDLYGAPVYVRKQIVHNKHVVSNLESRGAIFVEELDEVPEGETVVFSAHGVSPEVHRQAEVRQLKTIDATCPLVTKVHHEAKRFAADDYDILLIGHEGHEEVEGTAGEAPEHIQLVQSPADVPNIEVRDPAKVAWLSQTTLSVDETLETVAAIRERFPLLLDPPSDDICYATQNRQLAVKEIAVDADLVIVVGSGNSSNSVRLVEVALEAGAKASYRVDDASEIDEAWLDGVSTVSVTSGASVPEDLVRRRARLPRGARLPRRAGRAQRRGEPDLRAAARAAPRPARRRRSPDLAMASYVDLHPDNPQPRLVQQVVDALQRRRADRLPDRLGLRPRVPAGQPRRPRPDPADPRPRRAAPLHADVRQLRPARPVRARRQPRVPRDQGRDARSVHVHPAGDRRGARAGCMHPKKRTVGVRIPDHVVVHALLAALGEPLLTSTLILPGEERAAGPWAGRSRRSSTTRSTSSSTPATTLPQPTTVVDWSEDAPEVMRLGAGDPSRFEA